VEDRWVKTQQPPSDEPGMHRFVWDLLYPSPKSPSGFDTWTKSGAWALPGTYTVKLIVDGRTYTQPLTVKMDPNVKVSQAGLELKFETDRKIIAAREEVSDALEQANHLQEQLQLLLPKVKSRNELAGRFEELHRKLIRVLGAEQSSSPDFSGEFGPSNDYTSLRYLDSSLGHLEHVVESADAAPTPDAIKAFHQKQQVMKSTLAEWREIKTKDLPEFNSLLRSAKMPAVMLGHTPKGTR
jgi:hypothetical protein